MKIDVCRVGTYVLLGLRLFVALQAHAEDWPQWRGPNRDNVSLETGLLKQWPEGGPPLTWQAEGLGDQVATVSVAHGRICTVGVQDKREYALALSEETGQLLWATPLGPQVPEVYGMRWLTERTPTLDADRVYVIRNNGDLICLNATNGVELWRKNYAKDFGARPPSFGFSDYPLVHGDQLICSPGIAEFGLVALNKFTGELIWKCVFPKATISDYNAIVIAEICGVFQYVKTTTNCTYGIAANDGKLLWSYEFASQRYNTHTPVVRGDEVLVAHGNAISLLRINPQGKGYDVKVPYSRERLGIEGFQDKTLTVGERVYLARIDGTLVCISRKTGETLWPVEDLRQDESQTQRGGTLRRGRGINLASGAVLWMFADGHLITRNSDGVVKLIEDSPTEYVEKGAFTIPGQAMQRGVTSPVIAHGRLYLRDDNRLFCYDVRADRAGQSLAPKKVSLPPLNGPNPPPVRERGPLRSVFVPTPPDVVNKMLELAQVKKTDVVYDLGSGDGRIVIAAAKTYGCQAVGYEIDEQLVELSRESLRKAGVEELVTIEQKDLFTADLSKADVIALYLLPEQLEALVPQLLKLKPATRIVSHQFAISRINAGDVTTLVSDEDGDEHKIYTWTAPIHARESEK